MLVFQLIVVQVITFVGLMYILQKIMVSSAYKETKRLQRLNQENSKRSKELSENIESAKRQHRERMLNADDEIRNMRSKAREEIAKIKESVITEARQEKDRIIKQAYSVKEKLREEIETEMRDKSIDFSLQMLQAILSSKNQQELHNGVVLDFIKELKEIDETALQIKGIKDPIKIKSAFEIEPGQKTEIEKVLSDKVGSSVKPDYSVDDSFASGLVIEIGSLVLDGTLKEKLHITSESLRK